MESNHDGFDEIFKTLAFNNLGWIRFKNSETGEVAVFPRTEPDAGKWERSALAMHANQDTITLKAKPVATNTGRMQIQRGD